MDSDRLRCDRKANDGKEMARDGSPGDVRRTVYEAVGVEEGNPSQLVDPEVTTSLWLISETRERDKQ